MKIKNKNIQKGFIIGMTTIMVGNTVFAAAGTGVTFRPTLNGVKPVEVTSELDLNNPAAMAKRVEILSRSVDVLKLPIDKGTKDKLVEAMLTNKGLASGFSTLARDSAPNMNSINLLRVNIAALVSDIDVNDPATKAKADSDVNYQKEFNIMQLVLNISPRGRSTNTRTNVEYFLKQVETLLKNGVPRNQVLQLAAEDMNGEKGFAVHVDSITEMAGQAEGVIALFKGIDEQRVYDIGTVEGGEPLSLRMTAKELEVMEADIQTRVQDLVELAQTGDVQKVYAAQALKELNSVSEEVNRFMVGNTILDASSKSSIDMKAQTDTVATSIDELLRNLETLGVTIGGDDFKNQFKDALRSIPLVGKRLVEDRVDRIKTARGKITEIDGALVKGANVLQTHNLQLIKMKADVIAQRVKLQTEMARAKMSIDLLKQYEAHYRSVNHTEVADRIQQDILLKLERDLSATMILYGQMTIATASIDALVASNEIVITNANDIRRVAIQAIAIQETLKIANLQTKQVMLQQKAVQAYLATMTTQNVQLLKENAALLKEAMSKPMMEAAVIGKAIQDLAEIQKQSRLDRAEAAVTMGRANEEMVRVVNQISKSNVDPVGAAVDGIMNSQRR